jgi:hypothetical protein
MEHFDQKLDFRPVLLGWCALQAEEMGHRKCARKGVGGLTRKLRAQMDSGATVIYGRETLRAVQLLESFCRLCGKCSKEELE